MTPRSPLADLSQVAPRERRQAANLPSVAIGHRGRGAGRRLVAHDDLVAWIAQHRQAAA